MNCFLRINCVKELSSVLSNNSIQVCNYAARKGTRERMRKRKVKVEIKKVEFVPHNLRGKAASKGPSISTKINDDYKRLPVDNVWVTKYYKWNECDFNEAVEAHRETHHPQIYNMPDAPLNASIELDMRAAKKNKYVNTFTRIAKVPFPFDHGEDRSILVFCKMPEFREEASKAGATLVGDVDMIKKVEKGDLVLPDFQFILAHPDILPELVSLRGIMKKKFPNIKAGTLGANIGEMVTTFRTGVQYTAVPDSNDSAFGLVDVSIGPLSMDKGHLEGNLKSIIEDICVMKPKRPGSFITRILLKCPPSVERFKINLKPYLDGEFAKDDYESDSDDEAVAKVHSL